MAVFKYIVDPKLTEREVSTMLELSQVWRYESTERVANKLEADAAFCLYSTNEEYMASRYFYRRDHGKQVIEWIRTPKEFSEAMHAIHPSDRYTYARFKTHQPYSLEVTTKGDARFSPFFMKLTDGRSLENYYQLDIKGYRDLGYKSWKEVKGKPPVRDVRLDEEYENMMIKYFQQYPCMLYELAVIGTYAVFTDMHMDEYSGISQAKTYCNILNRMYNLTLN